MIQIFNKNVNVDDLFSDREVTQELRDTFRTTGGLFEVDEKRAALEKARIRSLEVRRMKKAEKQTLLESLKSVDEKRGELLKRME